MTWSNPVGDLRAQLSDGATDKHNYRKKCFGELNGTNVHFKTLEFRRITDFTTAASPLGVYKNGVLLLTTDFASDNPDTGDFTLKAAPADGDVIEASYYSQWFTDSELQIFLKTANGWLGFGDDYSNLVEGLRVGAMKYAAAEAYQKLASRWAQKLSEQYLTSDAEEKDRFAIVDSWMRAADQSRKEAYRARDDYYGRSGQANIPAFASVQGRVKRTTPNR